MSVQAGTPVRSCVCMRFNYPGSGVLTMILVQTTCLDFRNPN